MIRRLRIKNFQSHRDTEIEFLPTVNMIVGSSDQGKSSILRALYWLIYNRPLGGEFRSWFASDKESTEVELETWEGDVIIHRRDNSGSNYLLNDELLEAHGSEVPDLVKDALNIGEYNFSRQFDRYFLLQDTAGEVARKLNAVVKLDSIDVATKRIKKIISDADQDKKQAAKSIVKFEEQVKEFVHLPKVEKIIVALSSDNKQYVKCLEEMKVLEASVVFLEDCDEKIRDIDDWLTVERQYKDLLQGITECNELKEKAEKLTSIIDCVETEQQEITDIDIFLGSETALKDLLDKLEKYEAVISREKALRRSLDSLDSTEQGISSCENKIQTLIEKYREAITEADICPTCFTPVDEETLASIVEALR